MEKFNAKKETKKIIEFIRDYYKTNKLGGAVLGISGGKDSAVAVALMVEALGKENVVGLTLSCHSKEEDRIGAKVISDFYDFELLDFDLTQIFNDFKGNINKIYKNLDEEKTKNSDINLKPRLRMSSVYYFAALLTEVKGKPYLVVGTSNKCELFVGYFTKGGDSVHDIAPIADLTVEEVLAVGEELNVPKDILYKVPSDGLSNQTDEEKLGVTYKDIALYMDNPKNVDREIRAKIERHYKNNRHKFKIPTYEK
jgi:NAD+ synthetase